jgi:hypothetical protein
MPSQKHDKVQLKLIAAPKVYAKLPEASTPDLDTGIMFVIDKLVRDCHSSNKKTILGTDLSARKLANVPY